MERTLIILKPDAVNRSLVGDILGRFEKKGLKISAMKLEHLEKPKLEEHYSHHKEREFFQELIEFMSSIPSILVVLEGYEAVKVARKLVGATSGIDAEPGTIRGDYSLSNQNNVIHASESAETAENEIKRFFTEKEIYSYEKMDYDHLYSSKEKK